MATDTFTIRIEPRPFICFKETIYARFSPVAVSNVTKGYGVKLSRSFPTSEFVVTKHLVHTFGKFWNPRAIHLDDTLFTVCHDSAAVLTEGKDTDRAEIDLSILKQHTEAM
jgi:hypothetical protein